MRFNRIIFLTVFLLVIFTLCLVGCSATSDRQDPVVKIQIDDIKEINVYRGSDLEIGDDVKLLVTKESGRMEEVIVTSDMVVGYDKDVVGKQTVKVVYQNCETKFVINVREMEIQAIEIKRMPNKITVIQGGELPLSGITLNVIYQDKVIEFSGLTMNNIEGYTKTLAPGEHKIDIVYSGCKTSFYITVKERGVKSIEIQEKPNKTSYFVGDSAEGNDKFDPTGLVLKVNYDNNTSEILEYAKDLGKNIKFEYDFSQKRAAAVVTVLYGGAKTTYTCVVAEPKVVRLEITNNPVTKGITLDGVTYSTGIGEIVERDQIDWSTGKFNAIYDNGFVKENISMDDNEVYLYYNNVMDSYISTEHKFEDVGNFTIKVKYQNYEQAMATVYITVINKVPYKLYLGCTTDKINKVYKDGATISTDFLKYNILYNNGTYLCDENNVQEWRALSASELTADGSTLKLSVDRTDAEGYQTINFTVNGVTAGYRIKVEPNNAKKLVLKAPKVDYLALGDAPTLEGASLYVEYEDKSIEVIEPIPEKYVTYKDPNGIPMAGDNFSEIGVWQGIVTYAGASVTFDVNVVAPEEIVTSIILNVSEGERLEFAQFDDINFTDYIIEVTNASNVVSHVFVTEDMLYEYNPGKIGSQDVVLRYKGKTFIMPITIVGRRAVSIEIKTAPKNEYILGVDTELDVSGLKVIRRYSDELDSYVTEFNPKYWTFTGYDLTKLGEQTVTVSYIYYDSVCTTTFNINVSDAEVESIYFDEDQLGLHEVDGQKAILVTLKDDLNTTYIVVDYDDRGNPIYTVGEFYINVKYAGIATPIKRTLKASYIDYDKSVSNVEDGKLATLRVARINYGGKSTELYVKILDRVLESIEVFQSPDILIYAEGQALKSDGGIIKRNYSDGTSDVLPMTNGLVIIDGYDTTPFTTAVNVNNVTQSVRVSYNGKSTTFNVTTYKKLNATLNITNIVSFYGSVTQPIVSVTQVISSFTIPDTAVEYFVDGVWTDVLPSIPGTYPLKVTVFANEYYNAGEYVSGEDGVKSMTIARKVIDVKVSAYYKYYGEIDPTFEYTIDSSTPLVGDDVLAIKLYREEGEDVRFNTDGTVGGYNILWQADTSVDNQNDRYYINYSVDTAKFTIRQKLIDKNAKGEDVRIQWTNPASLTYDGNAKAYSAFFVIDGSNYAIKAQDLIYRNSRNEILSGAPIERGTYTVEVSSNYKVMNDSGKITFSII